MVCRHPMQQSYSQSKKCIVASVSCEAQQSKSVISTLTACDNNGQHGKNTQGHNTLSHWSSTVGTGECIHREHAETHSHHLLEIAFSCRRLVRCPNFVVTWSTMAMEHILFFVTSPKVLTPPGQVGNTPPVRCPPQLAPHLPCSESWWEGWMFWLLKNSWSPIGEKIVKQAKWD